MKYLITTLLFLLTFNCIYSQYGSFGVGDARAVGMGNTYTASSYGLYSIGKNPALLTNKIGTENAIQILMPNISAQAFTNSLSMEDLDFYFTADEDSERRYLNDDDKSKLLDAFENGGSIFANTQFNYASIAYINNKSNYAFAFSVTDLLAGKVVIPEELIDLLLNGNEPGRFYEFDDLKFEGTFYRAYSLSFATELLDHGTAMFRTISFGATAKYITGFAYADTKVNHSLFHTGENNAITGQYDLTTKTAFSPNLGIQYDFDTTSNIYNESEIFPTPAGIGAGIDVGVSARIGDGIFLGAALTDIGFINWTDNIAEHNSEWDVYIEELIDPDGVDSLLNLVETESIPTESFTSSLPTTLRLGIAINITKYAQFLPGDFIMAFDYNQGFSNTPVNSTIPRISLGAEWRPGNWWPLFCTGITFDQSHNLRWAVGFGYTTSFLEIYLSTHDIESFFGLNRSTRHGSVAFSMLWKFF